MSSKTAPWTFLILIPALRKNTLRKHCKGLSLKCRSAQMCSDAAQTFSTHSQQERDRSGCTINGISFSKRIHLHLPAS